MTKEKREQPAPRGHGGMLVGLEKPKDFKKTFKRLITYLKPRTKSLILVLCVAIFGTVFAVLGPKIMGDSITVLFEGAYAKFQGIPGAAIDFTKIAQLLLILGGLYVFSSLFQFIQQFIMASVAQKTVYDLREDVFDKMNKLPIAYFDRHSHGDILSRVTNDIDTIATTLQQSLTQFITSFVTIIGIIIMMLWISPLLTVIAVVSIPLSIYVIRPLLKKSQKHFGKQQRTLGNLNGHIEEMYTGHEVVKAFGHEKQSIDTFNQVNEELYDAGRRAQFVSGIIMPLMSFIGNISYVLISIVGGILVTQRAITIGDIQAFITYTNQFSQPISQTANIANIIQSTIAAAERVFELLDEQEEEPVADPVVMKKIQGNVRFEQVDFGYDDTLLMQHLNIDISAGQTVAIVGPTGAGKTTLINLLMRFYELDKGRITIDGIDIKKMKRSQLRENFGIVLQDTWLFKGTIKENIAYGKTNATEEEIIAASRAAHAHHFIQTLPDGYDTLLNEEASNISQGQKQLLTISRAMLANAPMMILDEATSSVDTRTEIHIQQAMNALMKNRTSFVIAHRLSTIKDADLILVMDQGAVIEQGTHEQLIQADGFYADLYKSQFDEPMVG
ncbi:ABC transporter ATP-binding protein [Pseudogracilibacillus auburnensis]|uniref:ATP-binding cassette subfamily B protein n=1 Tax=Pseudogracilibacillus auburnensis TaxID=1494959 RepID=A0A2V3W595_9BACI|nr:ABC transporter ATP-binding protein [Pseudogracilibacillus auburnensis]MBO1001600.1 ABC transporter ATP-binding protein [Pseudogracilibacillus auburnensis]PXW89477.1 ATP-binding cassette subfamily B protein [Pseudogracilibacillus auburnensis]